MSDYKTIYSDISKYYVDMIVPASILDQERYKRSKERERKFNENWSKQKVNLNEIVDKFIPRINNIVEQHNEGGVKYVFEGSRYIIKCNKVAGYLRIYDKQAKSYCLIDGTPSRNSELTHFKIKKREEM